MLEPLTAHALGRKGSPAPTTPDGLVMQAVRPSAKTGWEQTENTVEAWLGSRRFVFRPGSRLADMDGVRVWLHEGFRFEQDRGWLHPADLQWVVNPLITTPPSRGARKQVVLDPGHGGDNLGARSAQGLLEKERVLTLCRKVAVQLRQAGVEVRMTRVSDIALALDQRGPSAKKLGADVLISVHLNKSANAGASGIETFVLTEPGLRSSNGSKHDEVETAGAANDPGLAHRADNMRLGFALQRSLIQDSKVVDRGLKRARFRVLRDAPCPAALVECGFLSNPAEEKLFATEAYLDYIARRITRGILSYLDQAS